MAYTMEQYQKDYFMRKLPQFVNDEKMQDRIFQTVAKNFSVDTFVSLFSTDEILSWLAAEGRLSMDAALSFFSAKDIVSRLSLDERLEGLSPDEIQAYLQKLRQTPDD